MKNVLKAFGIALVAIIGFSMVACDDGGGGGGGGGPQKVTYVSTDSNNNKYTLEINESGKRSARSAAQTGDTFKLTVDYSTAFGGGTLAMKFEYSGTVGAAQASGATVSLTLNINGETITITIVGTQMTVITGKIVNDNGQEVVNNPGNVTPVNNGGGTAVTGVTLDKTSLNLTVGITGTLTATVAPSTAANKNVTWSSSNPSVATVNSGTVTAVAIGNATITVTTADGGKTATCAVTVASGGGGNTFTSIEAMSAWLKTQPTNTVANPYIVKLNVSSLNEFMNGALWDRYVSLDLSDSTFTSIRNGAFWTGDGGNFTSITMGNSVTSIGSEAFYGNSTLTSVIIGSNVLSIGGGAFEGCSGLTSITIPSKVISIGDSAFEGCSGLTGITIPNSVTSIGREAFYNCTILSSVTIGNSVDSIGVNAFYGCTILASITIPNSVASIGRWAFDNCTNLTSVTFQRANTDGVEGAFLYGSSLQTAYNAGKAGTYRRSGTTWAKQ